MKSIFILSFFATLSLFNHDFKEVFPSVGTEKVLSTSKTPSWLNENYVLKENQRIGNSGNTINMSFALKKASADGMSKFGSGMHSGIRTIKRHIIEKEIYTKSKTWKKYYQCYILLEKSK